MRVIRFALIICRILTCFLQAEEPWLPPERVKKSWNMLKKDISEWKIVEFEYLGMAADGGSEGFKFKTSDEQEFRLIAASSNYATQAEIDGRIQVYYFIFDGSFYKVERKSDKEKEILALLRKAKSELKGENYKDPALMGILESHLISRKYLDGDSLAAVIGRSGLQR